MQQASDTRDWAWEQVADGVFGDVRRRRRCELMLRRIAERAAGRLTEVFDDAAELQAAYDFVEGDVPVRTIVGSFASATWRRAVELGERTLYTIVDGTSLSLTDRAQSKDFGSVGMRSFPTRGLKVIDALGVASDGTPVGLLDVHVWARGPKRTGSRARRRRSGETEVRHWVEVIDRIAESAKRAGVVPWLLIDREGDCGEMLRAVSRSAGHFTVRASQYKRICVDGRKRGSLVARMGRRAVLGTHYVDVPKGPNRQQRVAALDVRIARLVLSLPDHALGARTTLEVSVVWARERTAPRGEKRLDWMLLTDRVVETGADAVAIIESYCHRWRIEDFHRTWKRGKCRVEDTQLRAQDHVVRWAAMLATKAARIERLKHLARTNPDTPATIELRPIEVEALRAAKRARFKKRTETVPDDMPTIATAVLWIAQWGGYQGKSSGGPPGSITIGRGLERLRVFTQGFELAWKMAGEKARK